MPEPLAAGKHSGDDGAGGEPRELHVEPVAARPLRTEEHELAADRVDRNLHAAVVPRVRGREAAPVQAQTARAENADGIAVALEIPPDPDAREHMPGLPTAGPPRPPNHSPPPPPRRLPRVP